MKFYNIKDLDSFFKVLDKCEGKVELVGEDIRINLKSKLAQYFSLAQIFSSGTPIEELEIIAENPSDNARLLSFMINGMQEI